MTERSRPMESKEPQVPPEPETAGSSAQQKGTGFARDFFTGCLALVLVGLVAFVAVPVLIVVFKLSALVVVPLGLLAILIICTAFLGKIINLVRDRWPKRR